MSPRHSARRHLPDLDQSFDQIKATFAARLEHLSTPEGSWGTDPTESWDRLPALPWPRTRTPPKGRTTR